MSPPAYDFDLWTAPWIPVLTLQGEAREASLREVLREADQFYQVADPSPVVTFGIYRLLTAILHHYLPLPDVDAWADVWSQERFPDTFLERVEAECAGRFGLFDAVRPFYQSADIPLDKKPVESLKSVGYLVPQASTGTNVAHFNHAGEARHAFCPACCARGLVHLPPFALAGGAGIKPGINGVPPLYVLPRGETLFHTLLLNFVFQPPPMAAAQDPGPLWVASARVEARKEKNGAGFVESLTWPPRRVRLFPDAGGECSLCGRAAPVLVRRMVFAQGWSLARGLPLWRDPWAAYSRKSNKADQADLQPVRPTEQKDVWRDFPGLFLKELEGQTYRPTLLDELEDRRADGSLPADAPVTFEVFGLRTDMQAKIFEWRQDHFEFPSALLASRPAARAIREALEAAETVDRALRTAVGMVFADTGELQAFASRLRAKEKLSIPRAELKRLDKRGEELARGTGTRRDFWQALERHFRRAILDPRLATGTATERHAWTTAWNADARKTGLHCLDHALRNLDGSPEAALRQGSARTVFGILIHSLKDASTDAAKGGPA